MSNVVEIEVKGKNSSKPAMASAEKDVSKLGAATEGAKKKLGGFGIVAGAVAGGALVGFLKNSVQGWQDHQKVLSQSQAVIKSTGGAAGVTAKQMDDLSGKIEAQTGVDGDLILAGENMLATFTNIKNGVGEGNDVFNQATQTVTDMSVALGQDTKNSAIQLGKALNDPIKGVTALSRVGVTFTKGQKDQIKSLVDSGKTMEAQKVILKELNKEFGGSAAAQVTASDKAKVAWHNLQDQIGQRLLPVLNVLMTFVGQRLLPAFSMAIDWIVQRWPAIQNVIVSAWNNAIQPALMAIVSFVRNQLIPAVAAVVTWIVVHWPQISAILATVWANIKPVLDSFIGLIRSLWNGVLAPMIAWIKAHWPEISAVAKVVFGAVAVAAKILMVALKLSFDSMAFGIRIFASVVRGIVGGVSATIRGISTAASAVKTGVTTAFNGMVSFFTGIPGKISRAASGMWDGIKNAFRGAMNWIIGAWNNMDFTISVPKVHIPGTNLNIGGGSFTLGLPDIGYLASGGVGGGLTMTDERGPEIKRYPNGTMVYPAGQSAGMASKWSQPQAITIEIKSGGSKMDDLLVEILRRAIRVGGNGNVQAYLGRA